MNKHDVNLLREIRHLEKFVIEETDPQLAARIQVYIDDIYNLAMDLIYKENSEY